MHVIDDQDGVRCAAITRYFTPTPRPPVPVAMMPAHVMLGLGILLLLSVCGMFQEPGHVVTALVLLVSAVGLFAASFTIYRRSSAYESSRLRFELDRAGAEPRPADHDLRTWLARDVAAIQERGRERLGLGDELLAPPQTVVGLGDDSRVRTGDDGRLRAEHYEVLTVFLTRSRVGIHRCALEFGAGTIQDDETRLLPYGEIAEIAPLSSGPPVRIDDGPETPTIDRVALWLTDGTAYPLTIGAGGRRLAWPNHRSLAAVRRLISSHPSQRG